MLLIWTPVTKNKETNHKPGSNHIISITPIPQPVTDSLHPKTSKYLIFTLEENELIRTFDRRRKLLKQVKNLENLRNYKNWTVKLKYKLKCYVMRKDWQKNLTLIRLGLLRVVFLEGVNLTPPFMLHKELNINITLYNC